MSIRDRLAQIVAPLPPGAAVQLPADVLRGWLEEEPDPQAPAPPDLLAAPASWRERLWTCPADMRLGVVEVAEACGRSRDWVYRACSAEQAKGKGRAPLPCARLDGELVFTAGAVREWIRRAEQIVTPTPGPMRVAR